MTATNLTSVATRSLRFFFGTQLAVLLGIAAATAVIVGALVVGDSVRHSLSSLVTNRMGNIEAVLHARVFFEPEALDAIVLEDVSESQLQPAILFSSTTTEFRSEQGLSRASRVQLLSSEQSLWSELEPDEVGPNEVGPDELGPDEAAINQALALELGVQVGDSITVVVPDPSGAPSDNPLGRREDKSVRIPRQKVVAILPDDSVGGINFVSNQAAPRNVFLNLPTVQDILQCEERINAVLVSVPNPNVTDGQALCDSLNLQLRPKLEDYGLALDRHTRIFPDEEIGEEPGDLPPTTVYDYFQVSSEELILDNTTTRAIREKLGDKKAVRILTYLLNSISKVKRDPNELRSGRNAREAERELPEMDFVPESGISLVVPGMFGPNTRLPLATQRVPEEELLSREVLYSIVVGVEDGSDLNLRDYQEIESASGKLFIPYCWINQWLADELDAKPGDRFQATFFEPETVDGRTVEKTVRFHIAGILPFTEPVKGYRRRRPAVFDQPPTIFNDPTLTPSVPGITDQDSILGWNLPFPIKEQVPQADDDYWENHRLTPKVFLPYTYAVFDDLFSSRFGNTTALRISPKDFPDETELRSQIEEALLATRSLKGLVFAPVRDQQLAAAAGTTPFDGLFLALSFFVIVAALLLVYLLSQLGLQQRASELGILQAQGFTPSRTRSLLMFEFGIVAVLGSGLGIAFGLAYAKAIIAALESWWIGAIATKFLTYFATWPSITIGAVSGLVACLFSIYLGLLKASRVAPLENLRGGRNPSLSFRPGSLNFLPLAGVFLVSAIGLTFAALGQSGMARAGMFFGSGMLLLIFCILAMRQLLQWNLHGGLEFNGSLIQLAWRSIARNPGRSLLSISLLSVATFLIASMGVFQISPSERGYAGFNLIGESSQPIYRNLGSGKSRAEVLSAEDTDKLSGTAIISMRARFAEDASCNNLFQINEPTILGVSNRLAELHSISPDSVEFEWAATAIPENPWSALLSNGSGSRSSPIPVILDQNSAMWSLKQGASVGANIRLTFDNREINFRTVGLLSNSVLQGKLLISEASFQRLFPELSGYSFFMINSGQSESAQEVTTILEDAFSNEGLDLQYSEQILERLLGVQNTYISAFQSLGALGLLLGTFGLIAVQVRSVLERRREFALMRAVGFSSGRLARILTLETSILLLCGLLIGLLCALVALVPYVFSVRPQLSFWSPVVLLLVVVLIGFCAAWLTIRIANRQTVLEGLRSE